MRKFGSILGGLTLLAIAAVIILTQTGTISLSLAIWQIILAIIAISIFITSVVKLEIGGVVVSLGMAYIALGDYFGLPHFKLWVVIVVTILAAIGLGMIFPHRHRRNNKKIDKYAAYEAEDQIGAHQKATYNDENGFVKCSNTMGALARYVNASNFTGADITNSFGSLKVYFDKATIINSPVNINVKNDFGEMQIFIPKEWNVVNKISVVAGEVKSEDVVGSSNAPTVELTGNVAFGSVVINRV